MTVAAATAGWDGSRASQVREQACDKDAGAIGPPTPLHRRLLLLPSHHFHQLRYRDVFPEPILMLKCGLLRGKKEGAAVLDEADVA